MTDTVEDCMEARSGAWIQTYSGRRFWPLDPQPEDVAIEDVAHALSLVCRFGGHCREFYSVAQHSVLVAGLCRPEHRLWGLLHDAGEAYLADITRPVKPFLGVEAIEERILGAVAARFGLALPIPEEVLAIDTAILKAEKRDVMTDARLAWGIDDQPDLPVRIVPWAAREAEHLFLSKFRLYVKEAQERRPRSD